MDRVVINVFHERTIQTLPALMKAALALRTKTLHYTLAQTAATIQKIIVNAASKLILHIN